MHAVGVYGGGVILQTKLFHGHPLAQTFFSRATAPPSPRPSRTMQLYAEFGRQSHFAKVTLEQLASVPVEVVDRQPTAVGFHAALDGFAVFRHGKPNWESFPQGGDLSWRGDLTLSCLQRLWRECCCGLTDGEIPRWAGFRLLNKSKGQSRMFKLELWVDRTEEGQVEAAKRKFGTVLRAAETQFEFVANRDKVSRTGKETTGRRSTAQRSNALA